MDLTKSTKKFLCQVVLYKTGDPAVFDEELCDTKLRREATDWLFIALSLFTYIYLLILIIFFFWRLADTAPKMFFFVDALQDPYLGALGVYVILKEIRQRRSDHPSRYRGEFFVTFWALFGIVSTTVVTLLPQYVFDEVHKIILVNSAVVVLIYLGALINK